MHDVMGATVKQLLNLVWFCKKVNIPFRVYGFTNCYFVNDEDRGGYYYNPSNESLIKEQKRNEVFIPESYRLLEFLSSEGNIKEFDRQIISSKIPFEWYSIGYFFGSSTQHHSSVQEEV
jgi:hypothetical protein